MLEKDKRFLVRSSAFVAAGARGQAHLGKRKSNLQYALRKTPFRRKKAASGDLFSGKAIFWRWAERRRAMREASPRQWRSVAAPLAAP